MPSNYKKLGDYIQPVNNRNKDLVTIPLLGVSIKKVLMPSIANIIGTDMSTYKLISKNQFAYGPVTSRNGDKISIALLEEYDSAMVSQAYTVFEVIDEKKLLPEYLMMWFRRPEFDRYARFISHGSAREIFDWAEMCDTELPIPSPEKQQEIVREYKVIQNRIALNNQLITKLEETAQAIYKQWFVDFEFPDENGKPYKSNGGEMVWCEELEKEIPVRWRVENLDKITNQVCVGFVGLCYDYYCDEKIGIPMLRTTDLNEKGMSYSNLKYVTKEFHIKNKKSQLKKGDILVARHGTNGLPVIFNADFEANCLNAIIIKPNNEIASSKLLHCFLKSEAVKAQIESSVGGSVQAVLNTSIISNLKFVSNDSTNNEISSKLDVFENNIEHYRKINSIIEELNNLLLAKMTKVKTEKVIA
jgi:type I restriction enzyme S subunit